MSFIDKLDRARAVLERQGRLSARTLGRELGVEGDELEELIEELVDVQQLARREGKVLVWAGAPAARRPETRSDSAPPAATSHPREPAETRKVVSIVFADLIGSTALHERLDAESARRLMEDCDAASGATFTPLADAVRGLLGIDAAAGLDTLRAAVEAALPAADADRGRIAGGVAALLAGSPAAPEETFFVVRRFLAGLAATKPVVLVIDDLHWAEPLLLDLVEHLVQ